MSKQLPKIARFTIKVTHIGNYSTATARFYDNENNRVSHSMSDSLDDMDHLRLLNLDEDPIECTERHVSRTYYGTSAWVAAPWNHMLPIQYATEILYLTGQLVTLAKESPGISQDFEVQCN